MPRPIAARIHPDAVRHNLELVRQRTPGARIWAVVKANAYGHGIERIYPGLAQADGIGLLGLPQRPDDLGAHPTERRFLLYHRSADRNDTRNHGDLRHLSRGRRGR